MTAPGERPAATEEDATWYCEIPKRGLVATHLRGKKELTECFCNPKSEHTWYTPCTIPTFR